jgi:hypothetical protein
MKYVSLALVAFLLFFLIFDAYKQIKKDKRIVWKHLKISFLGLIIAFLLIDTIYKR